MCVTAHPDDECFAFGGALALATREGAEVYVVCLTDGQAATNRGSAATGEELGKIRRVEFAASCEVLGVTKHELLDYQDGQLQYASVDEVGGKLVERMRAWRPHVVVTFGLDGALNTHTDHTMVSCFTSAAFHWAARTKRYPEQLEAGLDPWAPQKLFHQSTSFILQDREPLMPAPWTLALDIRAVQEIKVKAFHAHASQLPVFDKVKPFWDEHGGHEYYVLAAAASPQPAKQETSMFCGVKQ
jgi:LmbE family N-acetylglucosaminyl deacetylase